MRTVLLSLLLVMAALEAGAQRTAAWVVPWDEDSLRTLELNRSSVDEVHPVWFTLAADGSIMADPAADDPRWAEALRGLDILPVLQNISKGMYALEMVRDLIGTPEARERHVAEIAALVRTRNYRGIEIDYEWLPGDLREPFSLFIERLAEVMHEDGRIVSVCLHPKVRDVTWAGPGAQDWARLSRHADRLMLMVYGYSWETSPPGPVSPPAWIAEVLAYARQSLPAERTMIGLPTYGHDWKAGYGDPLFWYEARSLAQDHGVTPVRDASGELTFRFGDHTVYYVDGPALAAKWDTARAVWPGVRGVAIWRPGLDDPELWRMLGQLRRADSTPRRRAVATPPVQSSGVASTGGAAILLVFLLSSVIALARTSR